MELIKEDITGKKFGRLVAIKPVGINNDRRITWLCKCDCGKEAIVSIKSLKSGNTKSCGCYLKQRTRESNILKKTTHGDASHTTRERLYNIWAGIKSRCKIPNFKNYSERNIKICDEWSNYSNFKKWALVNGYKDDLTIERINNNGNYEPDNCKWIPLGEQARNRRNTIKITYNGKTQCIKQWAKETGIKYNFLREKLRNGCNIEQILSYGKLK